MSTTDTVLKRFTLEVKSDQSSHAYLISGQKDEVRETVRKAVKVLQNGKIDVTDNIECLDEGDKFGVKELRLIQNQMMLSSQSIYKTCYIENIERLSIPAVNSMLKILEEPPRGVVFFLGCRNKNNVLDTIISRCRGFEIKSETLKNTDRIEEILGSIANEAEVIDFAGRIENREEAVEILDELIIFSREKLIKGESEYADVVILAQRCLDDVKANVNFKLAIEVLLLRVIRLVSNMVSN